MAALQDATNEGQESLENNLFSWADPSPLFRGLVNAIAELGGLGADSAAGQQEIEEGGDKEEEPANVQKTYGCSWR